MGSHISPIRVLVAGGSYGGLSAALNLLDLSSGRAPRQGLNASPPSHTFPVSITLLDERDGFYHTIGSPLALADTGYAKQCWVRYADMPALLSSSAQIRVVQGSLTGLDPAAMTATYTTTHNGGTKEKLEYDYVVVATGLRRKWPVVPQALAREQYLAEVGAHVAAVRRKGGAVVVVVGGGAVGVEMAAELKLVAGDETRVVLVHSREQLLSAEPLPEELKEKTAELVREAGVELVLGKRLASVESGEGDEHDSNKKKRVRFEDGSEMVADEVIMAVSHSVPNTDFLPREAVNEHGLVVVRPNMMFAAAQMANAERHFAVGDAIQWSGIKRCGAAMHTGYFAACNVYASVVQALTGDKDKNKATFQELGEVPPTIGLAVGSKAVSYSPAQGVASGVDVLKQCFGNDLGFGSKFFVDLMHNNFIVLFTNHFLFLVCWNWMQLGPRIDDGRK